jgi:thioester reductase-like protein
LLKYVDQMVKRRRDAGLDAVTLRVGQIAGSKACGAWSTQDWVPLIIKTGVALGCFPISDGVSTIPCVMSTYGSHLVLKTISWLPVDTVVQLVRDVCSIDTLPSPVLNVVHPRPVTWDVVIQLAADALLEAQVTHQLLPLVPFSEWLVRLGDATTGREDKTLGTMVRRFLQGRHTPSN